MRTSRGIVVPMLAIIVGVAMMVGAVSVCLSNVETNVNEASDLPVELTIKLAEVGPGLDIPNYENGLVMVVNQPYDMLLSYTSTLALLENAIVVGFTTPTMNPSEIELERYVDGTSTWEKVTLTLVDGVIRGEFPEVVSLSAGGEVSELASLTYKSPGSYSFNLWVEGTLA